ncbi:MAG TPA: hypothetical protein VNY84_11120 [Acidimicrobiales bacterium]|nr:hypothetical protein [Acidimicrobiales bacterium]
MTRLAAEGLSLDVPKGWDARIFRRPAQPPETTHAVLHAANFALPADAADYGDGAVQQMSAFNVLVTLVEFHPSSVHTALFSPVGLPLPLKPEDADRTTLQRPMAGQAGIQRFFSLAGRAWSLYIVLGSFDGRSALVGAANEVLSTLQVAS